MIQISCDSYPAFYILPPAMGVGQRWTAVTADGEGFEAPLDERLMIAALAYGSPEWACASLLHLSLDY